MVGSGKRQFTSAIIHLNIFLMVRRDFCPFYEELKRAAYHIRIYNMDVKTFVNLQVETKSKKTFESLMLKTLLRTLQIRSLTGELMLTGSPAEMKLLSHKNCRAVYAKTGILSQNLEHKSHISSVYYPSNS